MNIIFAIIFIVVVGCTKSDPVPSPSSHTGDEFSESLKNEDPETQVGQVFGSTDQEPNKSNKSNGEKAWVYGSQLRVRSSAEILDGNILGVLDMGDELRVIGPAQGVFVPVTIVNTQQNIKDSKTYFVGREYLSNKKVAHPAAVAAGKFFMVQNIATEKLRVYETKCKDGSCGHHMILEADMAAGELDPRTKTAVGHYRITSWHKFYIDGAGNYPSWYDPALPKLPNPGSSLRSWLDNDLAGGGNRLRGAFGWYTAKVGPYSAYQWTHGTFGWGSDKTEFIEATRGFFANLFFDPRSHGCSRTDNETIAYLRQILPVGSTFVKVYAKEAYADESLTNYQSQKSGKPWKYILTKLGVRSHVKNGSIPKHHLVDREQVLKAQISNHQWLEEGSYQVDTYPDAKGYSSSSMGSTSSTNGNIYEIGEKHMQGVLLVDQGRLVNYKHPGVVVPKGGYKAILFPKNIIAPSTTAYKIKEPESIHQSECDNATEEEKDDCMFGNQDND